MVFQQSQGVLSIGYIYLVVLGILNESYFYNQIGIDILKYSSIMDILISPISKLASSSISLSVFFLIIALIFLAPKLLASHKDKKWFKKLIKIGADKNVKEIENVLFKMFLTIITVALLGFYLGTGLGGGYRVAKKIKNQEITFLDELTFMDGDAEKVEILGKNSSYVFYLEQGNKTVKVTPINGVIKSIVEKD